MFNLFFLDSTKTPNVNQALAYADIDHHNLRSMCTPVRPGYDNYAKK